MPTGTELQTTWTQQYSAIDTCITDWSYCNVQGCKHSCFCLSQISNLMNRDPPLTSTLPCRTDVISAAAQQQSKRQQLQLLYTSGKATVSSCSTKMQLNIIWHGVIHSGLTKKHCSVLLRLTIIAHGFVSLEVFGVWSTGNCSRLSQPSWLLSAA